LGAGFGLDISDGGISLALSSPPQTRTSARALRSFLWAGMFTAARGVQPAPPLPHLPHYRRLHSARAATLLTLPVRSLLRLISGAPHFPAIYISARDSVLPRKWQARAYGGGATERICIAAHYAGLHFRAKAGRRVPAYGCAQRLLTHLHILLFTTHRHSLLRAAPGARRFSCSGGAGERRLSKGKYE